MTNGEGERILGKPKGVYITLEGVDLADNDGAFHEEMSALLAQHLEKLLGSRKKILVAGLGNREVTPDALGPLVIKNLFITGHLEEYAFSGKMRASMAIAPGVMAQTGMETGEIIRAVVRELSPAAVITVDALASARLDRLGCTVQMTDTGITPGSGVGNARARIDRETTGVPVISIGIPTVVDALTLAAELTDRSPQEQELEKNVEPHGERMIVTPREIDLLVEHAAKLVGLAIGRALQPHIPIQDMLALTAE